MQSRDLVRSIEEQYLKQNKMMSSLLMLIDILGITVDVLLH